VAPGAAKVVKIAADGSLSDAVTGQSALVAIAMGPDSRVYVTSISKNFFMETPDLGQVLRLNDDGTTEVVVDGLVMPNGIVFDDSGNLYVTHMTVSFGPPGAPPAGQVLRFDGVAVSG
jgi:sugar lactone lactonase YvrE